MFHIVTIFLVVADPGVGKIEKLCQNIAWNSLPPLKNLGNTLEKIFSIGPTSPTAG
jgi:hypothetical protein